MRPGGHTVVYVVSLAAVGAIAIPLRIAAGRLLPAEISASFWGNAGLSLAAVVLGCAAVIYGGRWLVGHPKSLPKRQDDREPVPIVPFGRAKDDLMRPSSSDCGLDLETLCQDPKTAANIAQLQASLEGKRPHAPQCGDI